MSEKINPLFVGSVSEWLLRALVAVCVYVLSGVITEQKSISISMKEMNTKVLMLDYQSEYQKQQLQIINNDLNKAIKKEDFEQKILPLRNQMQINKDYLLKILESKQ